MDFTATKFFFTDKSAFVTFEPSSISKYHANHGKSSYRKPTGSDGCSNNKLSLPQQKVLTGHRFNPEVSMMHRYGNHYHYLTLRKEWVYQLGGVNISQRECVMDCLI